MKWWRKVRRLFTRKYRDPNPDIVYVRWYSPKSCQWSKWRLVKGADIIHTDPSAFAKWSGGQRVMLHYGTPTEDMKVSRKELAL